MKKRLFRILVLSLAVACVLPMSACKGQPDPSNPSNPSDPPDPAFPSDPGDLPNQLSDREVKVVNGSAIHENSDELGRVPEGLVEVVNKYMTDYEAMTLEGPLTTFQTSSNYAGSQALPTDAVMAYSASKENMRAVVQSWKKVKDKYELHLMTIINRTDLKDEYLSSDPSRMDQLLKKKDGDYICHSNQTFYIMPNDEWTEYVWEMVEIALNAADLKTIVFEEPDIYRDSGYSECFKQEWEKYYGEPWKDQTSSPEAMYQSQQLKVYLINRMMETLVTRIKEKSPDTKVYIATHSTLSYNIVSFGGATGIISGNNQYLATGLLDGMIGQTWSDTAGAQLIQDGKTYQNRFLASYLGYASYIDSAGDRDLFTLADPMGDGIGQNGMTANAYRPFYFDTIVAQMLQPSINRYQVCVWPSRAFEAATQDYRTIQLSVIAAQQQASGKAALQSAGTPGISYVLSDSHSYPLADSSWSLSSQESFLGMTLPLLTDGIPLTITAMENIASPEDLRGIHVLLLSFDGQKPMREEICQAIADWIRQGGVCLYVGGHDAYDNMESMWWSPSGSPLQALFDHMGLNISVAPASVQGSTPLNDVRDGKQTALEALNCTNAYNNYYIAFEGETHAILTMNGYTVGIDETIGEGRLIAVGLPSAMFAKTTGGSEAMRALTEYALSYNDYVYDSTSLMWTKRGNVVAAYSMGTKNVLTGKYIDLFDSELTIHTHYVLEADDSALLYDITDLEITDTPRVVFSGGKLTVQEESATVTQYHVVSPANATVASRVIAPEGLYPQKISATNSKGTQELEVYTAWDNDTHSLLVCFNGLVNGVNVTIEWGTTPVEDYELQKPAGVENFAPILEGDYVTDLGLNTMASITALTNHQAGNGIHEEFIIKNTSLANDTVYYCDGDHQITWCFDLIQYPKAYITMTLSQNYLLEVSTDGTHWTVIQDYVKVNGGRINASNNLAVIGIDSQLYAKGADQLYVRLSNADSEPSWGGAISQYVLYYDVPVVISETDPADYAPLATNLNAYDAKYASFHKVTVKSDASEQDKSFIDRNYAQANSNLRYCDKENQLYLKIDLNEYPDAVVALQISQNYRIQVSSDDRTYVTVQDWLLAGHEWSQITQQNLTYLILDSSLYADGSDALYIKLAAADTTQGWGAALYSITVYYNP